MSPELQWGILGTGSIAGSFAASLATTPGSRLSAIASRSAERASAFAERFEGVEAFTGYEALVTSEVDVVYIATPHHRHVQDAQLALAAGRHVLVEKPLALSSADIRMLTEQAEAVDRLVVEGMWSYFNPLVRDLIALAHSGDLGELRGFSANCGPFGIPSGHRALDPTLGGSFLWECIVYPLSLLTAIEPRFLEPDTLKAAEQSAGGANRSIAAFMTSGPAFAVLNGGVRPDSSEGAQSHMQLDFENAWVEIDNFYNPSRLRIGWVGGAVDEREVDADVVGFGWEIAAIAAAVRGDTALPSYALLARTQRNAELMERIEAEALHL